MSLLAFQQILADLIASPDLCYAMRTNPEDVFQHYDLSSRERSRLTSVVRQPGMSTSCSLYRANRLTPLNTILPLTCFLLGDDLKRMVELFWKVHAEVNPHFKLEVVNFADFLKQHISVEGHQRLLLQEVLEFELAVHRLRLLPRRQILSRLNSSGISGSASIRLHPLVEIVHFQHEPIALLKLLTQMRPLPYQLIDGDFYLLLDARNEEFQIKEIHPQLGYLLQQIANGMPQSLIAGDIEILLDARLVVQTELMQM